VLELIRIDTLQGPLLLVYGLVLIKWKI